MRLVRVTVAALVGTAVLASCSSGQQANETLPSTSKTAASPSSTLTPLGPADLPMPAEAREETAAGATAFVAYYVRLLDRAQTTLDSTGLRELSRNCETCTTLAEGIDGYKQESLRVEGGGIRLDGASEPALTDGSAEFSVGLTQMTIGLVGPDGAPRADLGTPEKSYPASGAALAWSSAQSSWLMTQLTIQ